MKLNRLDQSRSLKQTFKSVSLGNLKRYEVEVLMRAVVKLIGWG